MFKSNPRHNRKSEVTSAETAKQGRPQEGGIITVIQLFDRLIKSGIQPKDKEIPTGYFIEKDGQTSFVCGRNIVNLTEHFSEKKQGVETLAENVMRYEMKKP